MYFGFTVVVSMTLLTVEFQKSFFGGYCPDISLRIVGNLNCFTSLEWYFCRRHVLRNMQEKFITAACHVSSDSFKIWVEDGFHRSAGS